MSILTVLVMVTSAVPILAPTASAGALDTPDYVIKDFRVGYSDTLDAGRSDIFVNNGTWIYAYVSILNGGADGSGDFPIIVYDKYSKNDVTPTGQVARNCKVAKALDSGEWLNTTLAIKLDEASEPEDAFREVIVLVNRDQYMRGDTAEDGPEFNSGECTSPSGPPLGSVTPAGDQAVRHVVVDYKLNLQARNFRACVHPADTNGECEPPESDSTHEVAYGTNSDRMHFKFEITNPRPAGDHVKWLDTAVYSNGPSNTAGDSWKVGWRIDYTRANATSEEGTLMSVTRAKDAGGLGATSGGRTTPSDKALPLTGASGNYTFTLKLDPLNEFPEFHESDNTNVTKVGVRASDLVPKVGFLGTGASVDDPFSYGSGEFTFTVNMTLENVGDLASGRTTDFNLYIIRPDGDLPNATPVWTHKLDSLPAANADGTNATKFQRQITGSDDPSSPQYIPPGANKLVLVVDEPGENTPRGQVYERFESNNRADFVFYVEDKVFPVVSNLTLEKGVPLDDPETEWRENAFSKNFTEGASGAVSVNESVRLHWRVGVDEDDAAATVQLDLKDRSTGNVTTFNMSRVSADKAEGVCTPTRSACYEYVMPQGITDAGEYEVQVRVNDSAGHETTHPKNPFGFRVIPWKIQTLSEDRILFEVTRGGLGEAFVFDNGTEFAYNSLAPVFHLRINNSAARGYTTGYPGPEATLENKLFRTAVCRPDESPCARENLTFGPTSAIGSKPRCTGPSGSATDPLRDQIPTGEESCDTSYFQMGGDTQTIGTHYIQFIIYDKGMKNRTIERWYNVTGPLAEFVDVKAPNSIDLNGTNQYFTVDAHVRTPENAKNNSDFAVASVKALFTHERTGHTFEKDMGLKGEGVAPVYEGNWTTNVSVGWLKDLSRVGKYNVTLIAKMSNGGLSNNTTRLDILETVNPAPRIRHAGSTPAVQQEITLPVKFHVNATDRDFWWAELVIKRGNEEVLRTPMTRDAADPSNLTYAWTETGTPGAYSYTITVKDSAAPTNNTDIFEGAITLVQNLPPRFTVESPSFIREDTGDRFGGPRPKIQVLITDKDGIIANTIRLKVNGENVTLTESNLEEVQDPAGVRVTYTFPAGQDPFAHNETVTLNMTAQEANENDMHFGYLSKSDQSFRVDALPPRSLPPVLEGPFWSELDTDAKNVSLETVIRLTAEENADGAHTDVQSMRYRVLRTDASRWVTLTPGDAFTFQELIDRGIIDYLGSSPYKITYYATDAVGNEEEAHRSFNVVLDDLPPFMDGLASRLKGAEINSTWTDEHAGVNRVAAMARVNDGIYQPIALDYSAGVWSKVLDTGVKGDRVCYYLQAWDNVENVGTHGSPEDPAVCYEVGNAEPTLAITSPGSKAVVNGLVQIGWSALDPDGDDLTFKIYYRLSGKQNFVELASLPADTSSYALDSRTLADGTYDIQVTATDGSAVVFENVQVTIMNKAAVVEDPKVSRTTVRPGESVLLTAIVNKAEANVEARVFKAGSSTPVQNVTMHDDGQNGDEAPGDGVYSALVTFKDGGTYDVEIFVRYTENGQIKEATLSDAGQFTVKLTAADVFSTFAGLWVALVALAVACVGVGGYALFRRWRA